MKFEIGKLYKLAKYTAFADEVIQFDEHCLCVDERTLYHLGKQTNCSVEGYGEFRGETILMLVPMNTQVPEQWLLRR